VVGDGNIAAFDQGDTHMARTFKLNDIQLILLATAHQRDDGSLLPPPASLTEARSGITKAVGALIKRSLAEESDVKDPKRAWRDEGDRKIGVFITEAGRAAIAGGEREPSSADPLPPSVPTTEAIVEPATPEIESSASVGAYRAGTKQALVLTLVSREGGASLEELVGATGWLPHTTRAALTGLRKRGHNVIRAKVDGASRYCIAAAA
jgi:hypothetical protein